MLKTLLTINACYRHCFVFKILRAAEKCSCSNAANENDEVLTFAQSDLLWLNFSFLCNDIGVDISQCRCIHPSECFQPKRGQTIAEREMQ